MSNLSQNLRNTNYASRLGSSQENSSKVEKIVINKTQPPNDSISRLEIESPTTIKIT